MIYLSCGLDRGARENGHEITVYDVIRKNIRPCLGCGSPSMTKDSVYPQKAYELGRSL